MARSNLARALPPMEFRFTDANDTKRYGDRWYTYDESEWLRLPARELITLESTLGAPMPSIMNGFRASTALGDTAGAWLGVRSEDEELAGQWDEFNPITSSIEWRLKPAPKADQDSLDTEPPEQANSRTDSSPTDGSSPSMIWGQKPINVSASTPPVESDI